MPQPREAAPTLAASVGRQCVTRLFDKNLRQREARPVKPLEQEKIKNKVCKGTDVKLKVI